MSRTITVRTSHHWFSDRAGLPLGTLELRINPDGTVEHDWVGFSESGDRDFTRELARAFSFTGVSPSCLTVTGGTVQEVYDAVYGLPVPDDVSFAALSICGCNMGHCDALTDVKVADKARTYGEAMALWGMRSTEASGHGAGISFWEYPDSVFLSLEWWTEPLSVPGGCYDKAHPRVVNPPADRRVMLFSYGR